MSVMMGIARGMNEKKKGVVEKATELAQKKVYGKLTNRATVDRAKAVEAGLNPLKARTAKLNISYKALPSTGKPYTQQ